MFSRADIWYSREEFFGNNIHPKVIYSCGVIELLKSKHIEIKRYTLAKLPTIQHHHTYNKALIGIIYKCNPPTLLRLKITVALDGQN